VGGVLDKGWCHFRHRSLYLNKLARSTLRQAVATASKAKLANALPSGDTSAIVDLTTRMGASAAAQSAVGAEEGQPALSYRQATAERQ
jgi:hypothetical protein